MKRSPGATAGSRVRLLSPLAGVTVVVVALAALVRRWEQAGVPVDGKPVMLPATAAGLVLAGCALVLVRRGTRSARRLGRLLGLAVALIGFVALTSYLVSQRAGAPGGRLFSGEAWWSILPGPMVGLGLVGIGTAMLTVGSRRPDHRRLAEVAASATLVIALVALVGHAYDTRLLYGANRSSGTSVSTAVMLSALALGVVFTDPSRGIAALAVSPGAGGRLLRRLLPPAVLAPLLLGWLAMSLQHLAIFDHAFAPGLLAVLLVVLLVSLISRQAAVLHTVAEERERLIALERASRARVTNILESITDAFFAVDAAWRFTYANREAERLLRRTRAQLVGRVLWEVLPLAVGKAFQRQYQRALLDQKAIHFEEHYPELGAWFEVNAFPSVDGISVFFRDVTARRDAEQRLRQSEERSRILGDMIPQQVWITDQRGAVVYLSRRWYEYTGTSPEQTMGEGWAEALHPDDVGRTFALWHHAVSTGEPYTIEHRFRGADGKYRWFLGRAAPLRDDAGRIIQWFGTLTDISERKDHEQERERLLEAEREARAEAERRRTELERVTESRASLMRGFSHDVRNALNVAHVSAELLEQRIAPDLLSKQREVLDRMRRSMRTALRLIDDLLDLARAEAGQLEFDRVDTAVCEVADEVARDFHEQAAEAGLALRVDLEESVRTVTDPTRVRQILANLLSNAVKYALPGEVVVRVEQRSSGGPRPGAWIAVAVADRGPGIPKEKSEVIFQEYTRLDPKAAHGSGIGLAISRRIARLLGGELTLESDRGRGSTFTLWLPAPRPSAPAGVPAADAAALH